MVREQKSHPADLLAQTQVVRAGGLEGHKRGTHSLDNTKMISSTDADVNAAGPFFNLQARPQDERRSDYKLSNENKPEVRSQSEFKRRIDRLQQQKLQQHDTLPSKS